MIKEHFKVSTDNAEIRYIERMYDIIRDSELPLVIYGSGSMAKILNEQFFSRQIEVHYFCESKEFFQEGKKICDKKVWLYEELRDQIGKYILVVGSCDEDLQKKLMEDAKKDLQIDQLFVFPYPTNHYEMSPNWVLRNADELDSIYEMLSDDESRQVLLSFINAHARCLDTEVLLSDLWTEEAYFNSLYDSKNYERHSLVDGGAFNGDTCVKFIHHIGEQNLSNICVYAFEPYMEAFQSLKANMANYGDSVKCHPYALGGEKTVKYLKTDGFRGSVVVDQPTDTKINIITGDEIVGNRPITIIKMDLEGSEMEGLSGLKNTIYNQMPCLAICVYHKIDDIIVIPRYIKNIVGEKGYQFFLRHHSYGCDDTVLYAIPR